LLWNLGLRAFSSALRAYIRLVMGLGMGVDYGIGGRRHCAFDQNDILYRSRTAASVKPTLPTGRWGPSRLGANTKHNDLSLPEISDHIDMVENVQ
jgi:hypothetical protein